jgi:hypothetical protein
VKAATRPLVSQTSVVGHFHGRVPCGVEYENAGSDIASYRKEDYMG